MKKHIVSNSKKKSLLPTPIGVIRYFAWQFVDQMVSQILVRNMLFFATDSKIAGMKHSSIKCMLLGTQKESDMILLYSILELMIF